MEVAAKVTYPAMVYLGCGGDLTEKSDKDHLGVLQQWMWCKYVRGLGRDVDVDELLKSSGENVS